MPSNNPKESRSSSKKDKPESNGDSDVVAPSEPNIAGTGSGSSRPPALGLSSTSHTIRRSGKGSVATSRVKSVPVASTGKPNSTATSTTSRPTSDSATPSTSRQPIHIKQVEDIADGERDNDSGSEFDYNLSESVMHDDHRHFHLDSEEEDVNEGEEFNRELARSFGFDDFCGDDDDDEKTDAFPYCVGDAGDNDDNLSTTSADVVEYEVNIENVPMVPKRNRWREWMQVPTLATDLNPVDVVVQEAELLRLYLGSTKLEMSESLDEWGASIPCTMCGEKKATRAISPCGHYICVDCMTKMIMTRTECNGKQKAKCCAICQSAIGYFLRVY